MFHFRREKRRSKQIGAALIEFAIVATLLFALLFTIVDFALYGYVKLTMQHAVREGARYAITGRNDLDPDEDEDGSQERAKAILQKINLTSNGLLSKVAITDGIKVSSNGNYITDGTFGTSGEAIVLEIACEWPTVSPIIYPLLTEGKYKFTVKTAMKNEAF
ncbi:MULTISPECIES: TadE/TadG family type IV pilus assembly protein [unclassified Vibrio]|uniref:TadE/TadG family type IV pilus assembly protein n=1 Tax=unclassified Vibrio TaxID=2614977 RepID=UPI000AC3596B|nr:MULTISPECIES: TadE/TadG family type IV pilus assembly protein [unclassified Vibrio]